MPQTRSQVPQSRGTQEQVQGENPAHRRNGHAAPAAALDDPPLAAAASTAYIAPRFTSTGPCALTSITIQAAFLGGLFASGSILAFQQLSAGATTWRLPLFLSICAFFHFMEFWATARWNPGMADKHSFLILGNGTAQHSAYAIALVEFAVREWVLKGKDWGWNTKAALPWIPDHALLGMGIVLIVIGQTARSMAMKEAGTSFNHLVQYTKRDDHVLITSGIYRAIRHPSYFGFFYWALGTQLVLSNTFSFFVYSLILWKFFAHRIKHEERYLISFFGDDYRRYRSITPTWLPFVGS